MGDDKMTVGVGGIEHFKTDFDVLLTVHLSIILAINQLNAQIAQVERGLLSQPVHGTATYRCDDNRCCIIRF